MKDFKLYGTNEEHFGVYLEFYSGMSTREIWIDKLSNGQWSMDILVFGEYEEDIRFNSLDEVIQELVHEWYMDKSKADEVRKECEKITNTLNPYNKPVFEKESD